MQQNEQKLSAVQRQRIAERRAERVRKWYEKYRYKMSPPCSEHEAKILAEQTVDDEDLLAKVKRENAKRQGGLFDAIGDGTGKENIGLVD